ncbi:hypothetical protein SAMN04488057_11965 [Cyclobacterium lianum]|uniref:Glycosyltransferase RgtA/B/C/D-like domain-containing protein n=1 Tax=Cyclobacterium lianum TaxID=388280 RepID=A0A1M7QKD5_9BACT|nr:hypothetical protein [Cyclobacterium lianum]SHN31724.1 hypothetical protein SAMN04488057_11965 [Cyclobacterium lianum]
MEVLDGVFIAAVVFLVCWLTKRWSGTQAYSNRDTNFLLLLGAYHLTLALVFNGYLLHYGGDGIRYWELSSLPSSGPGDWSSYWGTGSAFIQWLNYPFSQLAGLSLLSGNLMYAALSFLGFVGAFELLKFKENRGSWIRKYGLLILFLPNVHFWTAGVGKEAWLFVSLVAVLLGIKNFRSRGWLILAGLLVSLMVRPIQGLALTVGVLAVMPFHPSLKAHKHRLIPAAIVLIAGVFVYRWIQGSLVYGFNFRWIGMIIDWQNAFLSSFDAESTVPMKDYSLPEKIMTAWFRPYLWEIRDFWTFAAALENSFVLFVIVLGLFSAIKRKMILSFPFFYWLVLIYALIMSVIFILALNNLGILMRMKSIFTPFLLAFFLHPLKPNPIPKP